MAEWSVMLFVFDSDLKFKMVVSVELQSLNMNCNGGKLKQVKTAWINYLIHQIKANTNVISY